MNQRLKAATTPPPGSQTGPRNPDEDNAVGARVAPIFMGASGRTW